MKTINQWGIAMVATLGLSGCAQNAPQFADDVALLNKHFNPIVLEHNQQKVVVLGELQGRVMSSTASGDSGRSFGWFNQKYIEKGELKTNIASGGADRLWFGPESGKYSIFFKPNTDQIGENIRVPEAISTIPYALSEQSQTHARFKQRVDITNYQGFTFNVDVDREITLLKQANIEKELKTTIGDGLKYVAFSAHTQITNAGPSDWKKETGLLSIWDLGAFHPGPHNTVVIPVKNQPKGVVKYFSPIENTHTHVDETHAFYRGDANYMNKIGIRPENTLPIMGAWDPERQVLTLVTFTFHPEKGAFVSSIWGEDNVPYDGDVINVFNDGPRGEEGPFGPFYEMETSSHALELKLGEQQRHTHTTMHFEGDRDQLSQLAKATLGVDLTKIESIFSAPYLPETTQ